MYCGNASDNLYKATTSELIFEKGLIVLNKKFTAVDKNFFIDGKGFYVKDNDFPFMFASITANNDTNAANFVWADDVIPNKMLFL